MAVEENARVTGAVATIKVNLCRKFKDFAVQGMGEPASSVLSEVTGQWKNRSPSALSPSVAFCQQNAGIVSTTGSMHVRLQ